MLLYLFWRLARFGSNGVGFPRMVSLEELEQDDRLRSALAHSKGPRPYDEALQEGLELCVARGTVLQLWVREEANSGQWAAAEGGGGSEQYASSMWYVLNTKESRAWVEALGRGEIDVLETPLGQMYHVAVEGRMHITDLHATLLALMGLDHEQLTYRYAGRDFRLTDVAGRVVNEIFA